MLKSLLVVLLVLFGLNFALAGDGQILTNGSEYKIYNEPGPFTKTPYTIQGGLDLTKKEIDDLIESKKNTNTGREKIISKVFNKWYTYQTITREYQVVGLEGTRIVEKKPIIKEVEVLNPALYFVFLGILLFVIGNMFKFKLLHIKSAGVQAHLSGSEHKEDTDKFTSYYEKIFIFASLATLVAIISNGIASHSPFVSVIMIALIINYNMDSEEDKLLKNSFGIPVMIMFTLSIMLPC